MVVHERAGVKRKLGRGGGPCMSSAGERADGTDGTNRTNGTDGTGRTTGCEQPVAHSYGDGIAASSRRDGKRCQAAALQKSSPAPPFRARITQELRQFLGSQPGRSDRRGNLRQLSLSNGQRHEPGAAKRRSADRHVAPQGGAPRDDGLRPPCGYNHFCFSVGSDGMKKKRSTYISGTLGAFSQPATQRY